MMIDVICWCGAKFSTLEAWLTHREEHAHASPGELPCADCGHPQDDHGVRDRHGRPWSGTVSREKSLEHGLHRYMDSRFVRQQQRPTHASIVDMFDLIAEVIADTDDCGMPPEYLPLHRRRLAEHFANTLQGLDSRFDRGVFLKKASPMSGP